MDSIEVRHSRGTYPVLMGRLESPPNGFWVTDENVHGQVGSVIPRGAPTLVLPPGEQTKSMIWLERICSWLANQGAGRGSLVVALGGGVIGDLVGFAAATYMRGVPYVQIPTTLLAQVDSSVGGKVAVDLPEGKNLVGAFHPPVRVLLDPALLETLSLRQHRNGMAEVCKYGFIMDAELASKLRSVVLGPSDSGLFDVIRRCVEHKARIVENDEFETKGLRAILNYGHTIGHALEQVTGYSTYLHGEAISIGMVAEARLGEAIGVTPAGTAQRVIETLETQGLPTMGVEIEPETLLDAMRRDKKAKDGHIAFSLLTGPGQCKLVENVDDEAVVSALKLL